MQSLQKSSSFSTGSGVGSVKWGTVTPSAAHLHLHLSLSADKYKFYIGRSLGSHIRGRNKWNIRNLILEGWWKPYTRLRLPAKMGGKRNIQRWINRPSKRRFMGFRLLGPDLVCVKFRLCNLELWWIFPVSRGPIEQCHAFGVSGTWHALSYRFKPAVLRSLYSISTHSVRVRVTAVALSLPLSPSSASSNSLSLRHEQIVSSKLLTQSARLICTGWCNKLEARKAKMGCMDRYCQFCKIFPYPV